MKEDVRDHGPRPFRFFSSWMQEEGFEQIVFQSWNDDVGSVRGGASIQLKAKLKKFKRDIKKWWDVLNENRRKDKHEMEVKLAKLNCKMDRGLASMEEKEERVKLKEALFKLSKKVDLQQKSKIKWSIEGDENSKYFHGILNRKCRQAGIKGVNIDGDWVTEASLVKNHFLHHFFGKI